MLFITPPGQYEDTGINMGWRRACIVINVTVEIHTTLFLIVLFMFCVENAPGVCDDFCLRPADSYRQLPLHQFHQLRVCDMLVGSTWNVRGKLLLVPANMTWTSSWAQSSRRRIPWNLLQHKGASLQCIHSYVDVALHLTNETTKQRCQQSKDTDKHNWGVL